MKKIILNPQNKTCVLGDLYGIFFEDLNHAADGGLYAQMVQNYAFEFSSIDNPSYRSLTAWEALQGEETEMSLMVLNKGGVSEGNPHYLTIEIIKAGKSAGFMNVGYNSGLFVEKDKKYNFSCYAKNESNIPAEYNISLQGVNGEIYVCQEITINSREWRKYELELTADSTDTSGRLALTTVQPCHVSFDFISLFPKDTFNGRENGLRRDIAQMLADLKPKFMRFPGGCLVHDGSLNASDRDSMYRWKNTIGAVENRPARKNNWNYNQTLGLGYYEYFLFCEDIGAKPVPILPAGFNPHTRQGATTKYMREWIDDALDLIEFANGGADTKWGKVRADMGHSEPFNLECIGIGNEEEGDGFFRRYPAFHRAIKEKYPDINIINSAGPFPAGREFEEGWQSARDNKSELVDEHYYASPEWLLANIHRYDGYDPNGPRVFLGEYASWGNTYYNALCEAAYMTAMEKNAKAVALACYAPLLCNADYVNWQPNLIWFDNRRVYGTANYYVQKLFMSHQGTHGIEIKHEGLDAKTIVDDSAIFGSIELACANCVAEYSQISLTDNNTGKTTNFDNSRVDRQNPAYKLDNINSNDYTLRFKAKRIAGTMGFVARFGIKDEKNRYEWILGGWGNVKTEIVSVVNNRRTTLSQERFRILDGMIYDCTMRVKGRDITGTVKNYFDISAYDRPLVLEELYSVASVDDETGDVILKTVNVQEHEITVQICLDGAKSATVYEMSGYAPDDKNSLDLPDKVVPKEQAIQIMDGTIDYIFPPQSVCVFRFQLN